MNTLTKSKHYKAVCGAVFAFLVCAGSFVPTPVYADLSSSDVWTLVNAGLVSSPAVKALKNSVVEQYTSLSPGELAMLEYEVGAVMAVGSVVLAQDWATEHGVEYNGITGSFTVTGLSRYVNSSNNLMEICCSSCIAGPSGFIFNSDVGNFAVLPVVSNGGSFTARYYTFDNLYTPWFVLEDNFSNNGADCQLSFDSSGIFDFHNGVGTFLSSYSSRSREFYIRGGIRTDWQYIHALNDFTVSWYNNDSAFQFDSGRDIMNYTLQLTMDNIDTPLDLYNQAYNKALEDYPEYIDNWVDLEDEFTGSEPSQFDSLEFPPYIPQVDFHDVELPSETLPTGLTDGAGFWFSAFSNMVDSFGLKPYVILFLGLILLCVMLKL